MEEGGKSVKNNHVEHPIDDSDSPPIQKIVEGRVYSHLFTTDRDFKTKYIASKYLYPINYTTLYIWIAYTNSTPCATFL